VILGSALLLDGSCRDSLVGTTAVGITQGVRPSITTPPHPPSSVSLVRVTIWCPSGRGLGGGEGGMAGSQPWA